MNGYPDRPPVRPNISLGDTLAGMHAVLGTVMALLHRVREKGQVGARLRTYLRCMQGMCTLLSCANAAWIGVT